MTGGERIDMATEGIVSIVSKGRVRMKVIAGSGGAHAKKLALWLTAHGDATAPEVYARALALSFGKANTLVVQTSPTTYIADGVTSALPAPYRRHFNDPRFHPRWHHGFAAHTFVLKA
jgi:hypothetical protein